MPTTINEDKLIAIHDSIQALAGNTKRIQILQEQVSAINDTIGEGSLGINNSYDLVIHNAQEFNDLIYKYKNGYTDAAGIDHPAGSWYTPVGSEAHSVLLVGKVITSETIEIPAHVTTLDANGDASITYGATTGGCIITHKNSTVTTAKKLLIIRGLRLLVRDSITSGTLYGFKNLYNLRDCTFEVDWGRGVTGTFVGYHNCTNLLGCKVIGVNNVEGGGTTTGYQDCTIMGGCTVENTTIATATTAAGSHAETINLRAVYTGK